MLTENLGILKISQMFVPVSPINTATTLVQVMAYCQAVAPFTNMV